MGTYACFLREQAEVSGQRFNLYEMCTVTYLPKGPAGYIITSNRDEDKTRPTLPVQGYTAGNKTLYYPKDERANGTWIAHEQDAFTLCLLNGANRPHIRKEHYRKSRGLVVLDFFDYNDPLRFAQEYDLDGIEPFTLLMANAGGALATLHELRWDEQRAELITHDAARPNIWSSVTLYPPPVIHAREEWFAEWLQQQESYTPDAALHFHHFAGDGTDTNSLIMNRGQRRTVSITCVSINEKEMEMTYEDLVNGRRVVLSK